MAQQQSDYRFTYASAAGDFDVIDFQLTEHLSAPFLLELSLSRKNEQPVDFALALDNPGTLIFWKGTEKIRYLNGIVSLLHQTDVGTRRTRYKVEIRPMFSRTHLRSNVRILQAQTVPDIIKRLLKENGVDKVKFNLSEAHETREYCVQYRETDQRFIERLAAEEGMFYYFEHNLHDHTLVFCDNVLLTASLGTVLHNPNISASRTEPSLWNFTYQETIATAQHKMRDYSFKNPDYDQQHQKMALNLDNQHKRYEKYDYPGRYKKDAAGKRFNQYRLDYERRETRVAHAVSDDLRLISGKMIQLSQEPDANAEVNWLIVGLSQFGEQPQSQEEDAAGGSGSRYGNRSTLIPQAQPWRPTPKNKPRVDGPQIARITGPKGEEIYCDEHGRVKVQFPWDLDGQYDDLSSCWVRVSQGWAGVAWGSIAIPRIGQEVIVSFLEGDPDQPIITGRTYHAYNKPPYSLPQHKTRMSIKSKTHKGEGFNELRFEDEAGKEQIFIHAQKDQDTRILNDAREWVGNDRHLIVKNDQFEAVEGNKHSVIKKDRLEQIDGDQHLNVKGDQNDRITGSTSRTISMDLQEKVGRKYAVDAGTEIHQKAGMNLVLEAGASITLKVGSSFISINPSGIFIQGANVNINSGGAAVSGAGSNPKQATPPRIASKADDTTPGWEAKSPPPVTVVEALPCMRNAAKQGGSYVKGVGK